MLAYLVAQPAQQIIATSQSYEYPLLPGVRPRSWTSRCWTPSGAVADAADLGDGKQALDLLQSVGLLS